MNIIGIRQFAVTSATALIIFLSGFALADDTEIYLGPGAAGVRPNVLFILDTSGSMENRDGTGEKRIERMQSALHEILNNASNINVGLMTFHREGGPVRYPVSNLDISAQQAENGSSGSVAQVSITESADDAEEYVSNGSVHLSDDKLELAKVIQVSAAGSIETRVSSDYDDAEQESSSSTLDVNRTSYDLEVPLDPDGDDEQIIGVRFQNIIIPANATIVSASVELRIDDEFTGLTNLTIFGHREGNPLGFSENGGDLTDRVRTTASIDWEDVRASDDNASSSDFGDKLTTPDLSEIVGELADSSNNWVSGGSMVFLIERKTGDTSNGLRSFVSHDKEPDYAPLLRIQYTSEDSDAEDQIIGLRFQDVDVPQGATIESATIEFEANRTDTADVSLLIDGEANGNASGFTADADNISSRTFTSSSNRVTWNVEDWNEDKRYQTPDLKALVQEIVSDESWCGGNPMAFIMRAVAGSTGVRIAKSFDQNPGTAPTLRVEFDENSVATDACVQQTFRAQISADDDDAAEDNTNQQMQLDESHLNIVTSNGGNNQTIGLRFTDIPIEQGTEIVEAYLELVNDGADSGSAGLTIHGEINGNSAGFSSASGDISGRTKTTAAINWNPDPWVTAGDVHQTPNLSSIVQEIANQDGWSAGNAISFVITGNGNRRAVAYEGSPANAARLVIKIKGALTTGYTTVRGKLHDVIDELKEYGTTPIADTLYEAARYYRGEEVFYGTTRGNSASGDSSQLTGAENSRVSHPASYTGGTVVRADGCDDSNPGSSNCKTERIDGTPTYISPISHSCQANNIILLSDGYPTANTSVDRIETLIGSSCSGSGDGKCGNELVKFLHTEDQSSTIDDDQTITTHTIGFNILSGGKDYLKDIAQNGGGEFFEASSSADLVDAFDQIISQIVAHPTSFAAPALSINAFDRLYHNNELYFSLFIPSKSRRWDGNVKKYKICEGNDGDTCQRGTIIDANDNPATTDAGGAISDAAQSVWSATLDGPIIKAGGAGSKIPGYASRTVYTYTGSDAPDNVALSLAPQHLKASNETLTKTLLGNAAMTDGERSELIDWILGKDVRDEDEDSVTDENRWAFGDSLHGGVTPVTFGKKTDGDTVTQITKLFVAGNDGTIRMINGSTGIEEWVFIPQEMLGIQSDLMNNIQGDHIYGIDGVPVIYRHDVDQDGIIEPDDGDFVYLYLGMRRGGRNFYALNVTPTATLTDPDTVGGIQPKLMWRILGGSGSFSKLGQTWSTPLVKKIAYPNDDNTALTQKNVLMFAGGYDTSQDSTFGASAYGNAIYIIDPSDGSRLWWASSDANADLVLSDMQYAIPSDLAALDTDSDGRAERLYVGDTGGQVWRVDLWRHNNNGIVSPTGAKLAAISSADATADNRKFFYPPDVALLTDTVYSSVANYDSVVIGSGNRAHPLDESVHNRFYVFRDPYTGGPIPSDFSALTTASLHDATPNLIQQGTDGEDGTKATALEDLRTKKGWYLDLKEYNGSWVGEKSLSSPLIIDGKIFFVTYVPGETSDDPCAAAAAGSGRLYAVNLLNAGAVFDWYQLDGNDEDNLTKQDRRFSSSLGSGIPTTPQGVFQEQGVSVVVGAGAGATTIDPDVGLPRHKTFWLEPNR